MRVRPAAIPGKIAYLFLCGLLLFAALLFIYPHVAQADAGYALQFNGSTHYVALGDSDDLMGSHGWTSAKTVSVWIRPTGNIAPALPPTSGQMIITTDRPRTFGISRANFQGADRLWIWNIDADGLDTIGVAFTPGEWVHVALVHDGSTLYAYRNGELVGATSSGNTAASARNDGSLFLAGSGRADSSLYFAGELDEVRFWAAPLDGATVASYYNRSVDGSHPAVANLRAYYQMSDGAGTLLSDAGPFANHGLLQGGMGDANWVISSAPLADGGEPPTATATPTSTALQPATPTPVASNTPTATALPPAATPTALVPPTATPTATATATPLPPTPTPTSPPPSDPVEVGFVNTPGFAYTVRVADDTAYVADVTGGLRIYDVSNPANPVELGFYIGPRRVYGVAVAGPYAYAAATSAGVRVLDVSNPARPVEVAAFAQGGFAWAVTVHQGYAYVGDRDGRLHIANVADPRNPIETSTINLGNEVLGIAVAGNYAYVAAYTSGLQVLDISNPAAPVVVGSLGTARAYDLHLVGDHVFLADGGSGLRIIDVSNPAQPVLTGSLDTGGWARSAFVRRDLAYIGDWTAGVTIATIADYAAPALASSLFTPGKPRDVWIAGDYLYVAAYEGGLRIFYIGP